MSELSEVVLDILRREGADQTMILGARLGAIMHKEHGELLREEMDRRGARFIHLVEDIPGIRVLRNLETGLDVLIGLEESLPPASPSGSPQLRADVYAAFTRLGTPYSYDASVDRFHPGLSQAGDVACPEVALMDLMQIRKEFAETLAHPLSSEISATVEGSGSSLSAFREAVSRNGLTAEWEAFRYRALREAVQDWAASQGVEIQGSWFQRGESTGGRRPGARQLLAELAHVMTDEEARGVVISLGTIHRYLSRRQQRHQP